MAEESIIKKTKEYDKFLYIQGNRTIIPGHVARLAASILQKNMLPQNPIIINEKWEIIDGQHRLEVAKNNDLDIYYIVVPGATISEIISLNSNNRVWNSNDYVNSWASQGHKDFIWLRSFLDNYGISISAALLFLYGTEGSTVRASLKRGALNLSEEQKENAEKRADVLWEIRPFMIRNGFTPRAFLQVLIETVDAGYGTKLVKGVKARGQSFIAESEKKAALNQIKILMGV